MNILTMKKRFTKKKKKEWNNLDNKLTSYESHFRLLDRAFNTHMQAEQTAKMNAKIQLKRQIRVVVIWPPWDSTVPCRWLFAYFTRSLSAQCIFACVRFFSPSFSLVETNLEKPKKCVHCVQQSKRALKYVRNDRKKRKSKLIKINSIINKII